MVWLSGEYSVRSHRGRRIRSSSGFKHSKLRGHGFGESMRAVLLGVRGGSSPNDGASGSVALVRQELHLVVDRCAFFVFVFIVGPRGSSP